MKFLIHVMNDRRAYKPHEPVEVVAKWHFYHLDTNHNGVSKYVACLLWSYLFGSDYRKTKIDPRDVWDR